jgi:hypothetical protein
MQNSKAVNIIKTPIINFQIVMLSKPLGLSKISNAPATNRVTIDNMTAITAIALGIK